MSRVLPAEREEAGDSETNKRTALRWTVEGLDRTGDYDTRV